MSQITLLVITEELWRYICMFPITQSVQLAFLQAKDNLPSGHLSFFSVCLGIWWHMDWVCGDKEDLWKISCYSRKKTAWSSRITSHTFWRWWEIQLLCVHVALASVVLSKIPVSWDYGWCIPATHSLAVKFEMLWGFLNLGGGLFYSLRIWVYSLLLI